jgi:drug/metabolite transporter (DMT)-like permease
MSRRGWLLFIALGVIWGIPYLLIKVAVGELAPASLVFLRTALGAAVLLPVVVWRGEVRAVLARWRPIALFTVIEMAIPWLLLSHAERRVTSSLAGLFMASVPLVGAALARVTGKHEPLGTRRVLGLVVGLAGVIALLGLDLGRGDAAAIVALAIVALGYAVGPLIIARRLADLPVLDVVAASLALCAVGYAPIGLAQLPARTPSWEVMGAVVVLGLACTAVAFLIFFRLIAEVGPVRATVITYVNPAVAVAAGVALLGEPFTMGTAIGFVLILAGSWLATGPAAVESSPREPGEPASATGGG